MMDVLFNGVGWTDIALTLNRIAVGAFFALSGYHKLFNPQRHRALTDQLKELGIHALGFNQWWVPTVEFTAGSALVIGILAPLAAFGLLFLILVAIGSALLASVFVLLEAPLLLAEVLVDGVLLVGLSETEWL